jgi:hypothetical protein
MFFGAINKDTIKNMNDNLNTDKMRLMLCFYQILLIISNLVFLASFDGFKSLFFQ